MWKTGAVPRTGFISHPDSPICDLISSWGLASHHPSLEDAGGLGNRLSSLQLQGPPHPEPQPLPTPSFLPRSQSRHHEQSSGQGRAGREAGPAPSKLTTLLAGLRHCVEGSGQEDW